MLVERFCFAPEVPDPEHSGIVPRHGSHQSKQNGRGTPNHRTEQHRRDGYRDEHYQARNCWNAEDCCRASRALEQRECLVSLVGRAHGVLSLADEQFDQLCRGACQNASDAPTHDCFQTDPLACVSDGNADQNDGGADGYERD